MLKMLSEKKKLFNVVIYEEKYTPENNYKLLMKIYQDVLSEK